MEDTCHPLVVTKAQLESFPHGNSIAAMRDRITVSLCVI
jgi:hypothetical protein